MIEGMEVGARRRHQRYCLDARASVSTPTSTLEGWTLNVSMGGFRVLIEVDDPTQIAGDLREAIVVVTVSSWPARLARVVWALAVPGGVLVGLSCQDLRKRPSVRGPEQAAVV
jgi:hypothetical protein